MEATMIGQKIKTFNFVKLLGKGAWAEVYLAVDDRDKSQLAIKVISKRLIKETPKLQELVKTEIKVLKSCKSQNVIAYIDSFQSQKSVFICTEFCNGGDLEAYLQRKKSLTEDQATMFLRQILNGFKGLHEVKAMHRDFKVANILLHNSICKIADLGFAKVLSQKKGGMTGTILGTSLTMAPEVLDEQLYGFEADIWSVGVVFYQMLYNKYPYMGINDFQILKKIKKNRPDFSGVQLSGFARQFLDRCLTADPKQRISWREIYEHPLIKNNSGFLYGSLKSKINIAENKDFYNKKTTLDENNMLNGKFQFAEGGDIRASSNMDELLKIAEYTKELDIAMGKYEKMYLRKRNDIMFIFKFIAPFAYSLFEIKATHQITMFIMSKKAYLEMKQLHSEIVNRKNIMKIDKFWNQFVSSPLYTEIAKQLKSDIETIVSQCLIYREDIVISNAEVKAEYDIEVVKNKNFKSFFKNTISDYWYLLADGLTKLDGPKKHDLIKVLTALGYLKEKDQINSQQFDRLMAHLDFNKAEANIKAKIQEQFKVK